MCYLFEAWLLLLWLDVGFFSSFLSFFLPLVLILFLSLLLLSLLSLMCASLLVVRKSYHLGTADFPDLAGSRPEGCLPADHAGAVGEHRDADEGVRVGVPADDGVLVVVFVVVLVVRAELLLHVLLGLHREVDVGYLEVHRGDQLDPRDL